MVMGYDLPPDLSGELAAADKIISDLEKKVERLREELEECRTVVLWALALIAREGRE